MNILILQSKGKHIQNQNFRECLCLQRALNKLKISSLIWGPGFSELSFDEVNKWCDCIILLENYDKKNWIPDLSKVNKLKLFWSIDPHVVFKRHKQFSDKNKVNIILCAIQSFCKKFKQKSYWIPNCYDDNLIKPMNIKKQYNVGFCGNYVNRKKWIDKLHKDVKLQKHIFIIGKAMIKVINSYWIHFNRNYGSDINYRTFETLGCRTFLLTNKTENLDKLFTIGRHLVIYKDYKDCLDKINYFLNDLNKNQTIAKAGYEHVKKFHTYNNRAKQIIEIIEENI